MEKKLSDFVENATALADTRNIGVNQVVSLKIQNPLTGKEHVFVCSLSEPSNILTPINTMWIVLDPASARYKTVLRLVSSTPSTEFFHTWAEVNTYNDLFTNAQHYEYALADLVPGPTGPTGAVGPRGPQGNTGTPGLDSNTPGPMGFQGSQGVPGLVGATGARGLQGIQGFNGTNYDPSIAPKLQDITFKQRGIGTINQDALTLLQQLQVNVRQFGAIGNGVADDTLAIQAAITSLDQTGGEVVFPPGYYKVTSTIFLNSNNGVTLRGYNFASSVILVSNPTVDIFVSNGNNTVINRLSITSNVVRSAGAYVVFRGANNTIENFEMAKDFIGIQLEADVTRVLNGRMDDSATGGARIRIIKGTAILINNLLIGAQVGAFDSNGIEVFAASRLTISNCTCLGRGFGLSVIPRQTEQVGLMMVSNCVFDTGYGGIIVSPTGNGIVNRINFVGCAARYNLANGIAIENRFFGTCYGVTFTDCDFSDNGLSGLSIGAVCENTTVNGGLYAANAFQGINVYPGVQYFSILNATIGNGFSSKISPNQGYGILIGSGAGDHYIIQNNRLTGNVAGNVLDNGTGVNKSVQSSTI